MKSINESINDQIEIEVANPARLSIGKESLKIMKAVKEENLNQQEKDKRESYRVWLSIEEAVRENLRKRLYRHFVTYRHGDLPLSLNLIDLFNGDSFNGLSYRQKSDIELHCFSEVLLSIWYLCEEEDLVAQRDFIEFAPYRITIKVKD